MPKKSEIRIPGKRYKGDPPEAAPIVGPQTREEWFLSTMKAIREPDAPAAVREEYHQVLELYPALAARYGDLATLYRGKALERFKGHPTVEEAVKFWTLQLRAELAGPNPTPLELLLIDVVLAARADYWVFAFVYEDKNGESFTLEAMEKWERILSSKEQRYLRAIGELARVRRLLNLPAPQVNINMPGGQQVNVNGKVET